MLLNVLGLRCVALCPDLPLFMHALRQLLGFRVRDRIRVVELQGSTAPPATEPSLGILLLKGSFVLDSLRSHGRA